MAITVLDSNTSTNTSTFMTANVGEFSRTSNSGDAKGQSFIGNNKFLSSAQFRLFNSGPSASYTGTIYAEVFATTGTHGTSAVTSGAALATSDKINMNALAETETTYTFNFRGNNQILLRTGVTYIVCCTLPKAQQNTNYTQLSISTASPHAGNPVQRNYAAGEPNTSVISGFDLWFVVNVDDTHYNGDMLAFF